MKDALNETVKKKVTLLKEGLSFRHGEKITPFNKSFSQEPIIRESSSYGKIFKQIRLKNLKIGKNHMKNHL